MSAQLRIPLEMIEAWVTALAPRTDLRGAPAVAKEMEALLARGGSDGHAVVGRHQLFTWAETLQGVARRAPLGSPVQAIVEEIRAVLAGKDVAAAQGPATSPSYSFGPRPAAGPGPGFAPSSPPHPASPYGAPPASGAGWGSTAPPVTYARGAAAAPSTGSGGALRLVPETETANVVAAVLREARRELLVVSPWTLGLETLVADLVRTSPTVTLRVVSRRADREDEVYHRAMRDLQRRGADLVMSPFLHTRMIVADGESLLLGAAGLPKPGFNVAREAALLTADRAVVEDARQHFLRIHDEARRGGR